MDFFFDVKNIVEYLCGQGTLQRYLAEARSPAAIGGTSVELSVSSGSTATSQPPTPAPAPAAATAKEGEGTSGSTTSTATSQPLATAGATSGATDRTTLDHSQCSLTCKVANSNAFGKPCLGLALNKYGVENNVETIRLLERPPIQNGSILLVGYTAFGVQLLESADDRDRRDAVHMLAFNHLVKIEGSTIWTWLQENRGGAVAVGENHISNNYSSAQRVIRDKPDLKFDLVLFSPYLEAEHLRLFIGTLKGFRNDRATRIVGSDTEIWLPVSSSHATSYEGLKGFWNRVAVENHPLHIADEVYCQCCDNSNGRLVRCGNRRKQDSYWIFRFSDEGTEQMSPAGENPKNYSYLSVYILYNVFLCMNC